VVRANPSQSKHLETAMLAIAGTSVDFAQLRHEEYASSSRIPTISTAAGTPLDDARRRDLTINALYYNIHTDEIEDYTGFGVRDIDGLMLQSPDDPMITLEEESDILSLCVVCVVCVL